MAQQTTTSFPVALVARDLPCELVPQNKYLPHFKLNFFFFCDSNRNMYIQYTINDFNANDKRIII